jgi:hypothetical protein
MHQAKIPGMESISKPRLMIEIYTYQEILSTDDLSIDGLSFPPSLLSGLWPGLPRLFPLRLFWHLLGNHFPDLFLIYSRQGFYLFDFFLFGLELAAFPQVYDDERRGRTKVTTRYCK